MSKLVARIQKRIDTLVQEEQELTQELQQLKQREQEIIEQLLRKDGAVVELRKLIEGAEK